MKILITGDQGFIGQHLARACAARYPHAEVLGWDRARRAEEDIAAPYGLPTGDITHVFHCAAQRGIPQGEQHPYRYIFDNCWGTVNLLRHYPQARVVFLSSSSAEAARSIYGMTKQFGEQACRQHPNAVAVRLYNVFGEGQPLDSGAVIPRFCHAHLLGQPLVIEGTGRQQRDFTYVGDVVASLCHWMFDTTETGLVHCGYGQPMSVLALARSVGARKTTYVFSPARAWDILRSKAPYAMPTQPYGRRMGLARTLQWWRTQLAAMPAPPGLVAPVALQER